MLFLVGLGVEQSPILEAIEILKACDDIFFESYTSPALDSDLMATLLDLTKKEVRKVSREFVEDGRKILELSREKKVALVCFGDPLIATTHQELRIRALNKQIKTKILHGSSILSSLAGEMGLSTYSFGKTVTMTRSPMQYTAYNTIFQNLLRGLHTTLLLEWDEATNFFLLPKDAIASLLQAENDLKYKVISEQTLVLVASGIGSANIKITACKFEDSSDQDFGSPPLTLVIPGKLHFTEIEALEAITGKKAKEFSDNSEGIEKIARQMVTRYSKKTLLALERAKNAPKGSDRKYKDVFENVELYTQDSLRFLNEGKEELAVLSIGYAEGLLDSLRFSGELEFEW